MTDILSDSDALTVAEQVERDWKPMEFNDDSGPYELARKVKELLSRQRWQKYPDERPKCAYGFGGDSRHLCWIETSDGMAYIGLRAYRLNVEKGADPMDWQWYSGSVLSDGKITYFMPLPQSPEPPKQEGL